MDPNALILFGTTLHYPGSSVAKMKKASSIGMKCPKPLPMQKQIIIEEFGQYNIWDEHINSNRRYEYYSLKSTNNVSLNHDLSPYLASLFESTYVFAVSCISVMRGWVLLVLSM